MKIEIEYSKLKSLLHAATGNVRDFVMNQDEFINTFLGTPPFLITDDGVAYYNDDEKVWDTHDFENNSEAARVNLFFLTKTEVKYAKNLKRKFFSTEKAARNYMKCHVKLLSFNDVWNLSSNKSSDNYVVVKKTDLLQIVKDRMNGSSCS